jgi:hypothetical protein
VGVTLRKDALRDHDDAGPTALRGRRCRLIAGGLMFEAVGAATFVYSAGLSLVPCVVARPLVKIAPGTVGSRNEV